jgi:uncharacterized paraquat-inducible protein A
MIIQENYKGIIAIFFLVTIYVLPVTFTYGILISTLSKILTGNITNRKLQFSLSLIFHLIMSLVFLILFEMFRLGIDIAYDLSILWNNISPLTIPSLIVSFLFWFIDKRFEKNINSKL